jgi:hypothetical protein
VITKLSQALIIQLIERLASSHSDSDLKYIFYTYPYNHRRNPIVPQRRAEAVPSRRRDIS